MAHFGQKLGPVRSERLSKQASIINYSLSYLKRIYIVEVIMSDQSQVSLVNALVNLTNTLETVTEKIIKIFEEKPKTKPTDSPVISPPVNYGEWVIDSVDGMWGSGTNWKKVGFLARTNNYNCHTKSNTTIYHEFTKFMLKDPRNRNFWMTGNNVEYYLNGQLIKETESEFRVKHRTTLKQFFVNFVDSHEEELEAEAKKVLGDQAGCRMAKLLSYIETEPFSNPRADTIYSNVVCKAAIKRIRRHLASNAD
jgi:hypothetical protein